MKAVLCLLIAVVLVACAQAALTTDQYQFLFTRYVDNYSKQYETRDILKKFAVFQSNLDYIIESNQKLKSFKMGVNQFTDMTTEEFAALMTLQKEQQQEGEFSADVVNAMKGIKIQSQVSPVDWRPQAQPIKNQGSCGSCWAFGANTIIEAQTKIQTGKSFDLSEQQQVSCNKQCSGCNGGLPEPALAYAKNGLCTTADYPYTATNGSCKTCSPVVKVTEYVTVQGATDCANHIEAIAKGPINIGVAAGNKCFQFYSSGVLTLNECPASAVGRQDHSVSLFGIDSENGVDFFYLRNSWGASWGEQGYMRIATKGNVANSCTASYDRQVKSVELL